MIEIVAEFTYNHLGDIDRAKRMIDAAKASGATCVKFEIRNSDSYFRNNPKIRDLKKRYEFSDDQIREFVEHCKDIQISWFASAHDIYSLRRVLRFNPKYIKIASREARESNFLTKVREENKNKLPVLISTGGLSFRDINRLYELFKDDNLTLLHTSSLYPCEEGCLNMNRIKLMIESFSCNIGYSGHEEGFVPSIYAVTLGVSYVERHFTLEEKDKVVAKVKNHFTDELCTLGPATFKEMTEAIGLFIRLKKQAVSLEVSDGEMERINGYGVPDWDGSEIFLR